MVPLTGSLYVMGDVSDINHVLVDIGTNYYAEKSVPKAKDYFDRRINGIKDSMELAGRAIADKKKVGITNRRVILCETCLFFFVSCLLFVLSQYVDSVKACCVVIVFYVVPPSFPSLMHALRLRLKRYTLCACQHCRANSTCLGNGCDKVKSNFYVSVSRQAIVTALSCCVVVQWLAVLSVRLVVCSTACLYV